MSEPDRYEIRVRGQLDGSWAPWFGGFRIEHRGGDTVLFGAVADQAALHGVLVVVRDLGLFLVSVVLQPDSDSGADAARSEDG